MRSNENYTHDIKDAWSAALRLRRCEKGITLMQLSYKADISYSMLCQYETASVIPRADKAVRIARVLGWTVEEWSDFAHKIYIEGKTERRDSRGRLLSAERSQS
jgi:transcriptional regulator with XRE-family HTH domain